MHRLPPVVVAVSIAAAAYSDAKWPTAPKSPTPPILKELLALAPNVSILEFHSQLDCPASLVTCRDGERQPKNPLFVVNGVPFDNGVGRLDAAITCLSIAEIQSIEILKGEGASAVLVAASKRGAARCHLS